MFHYPSSERTRRLKSENFSSHYQHPASVFDLPHPGGLGAPMLVLLVLSMRHDCKEWLFRLSVSVAKLFRRSRAHGVSTNACPAMINRLFWRARLMAVAGLGVALVNSHTFASHNQYVPPYHEGEHDRQRGRTFPGCCQHFNVQLEETSLHCVACHW